MRRVARQVDTKSRRTEQWGIHGKLPRSEAELMAGTDILSLRWWFENRQTGRITIAQFPNWPIFTVAALFVVRRILPETGVASVVADGATTGLLLYWGFDELIRGVNPWRRVLGSLVICWQVSRLIQ